MLVKARSMKQVSLFRLGSRVVGCGLLALAGCQAEPPQSAPSRNVGAVSRRDSQQAVEKLQRELDGAGELSTNPEGQVVSVWIDSGRVSDQRTLDSLLTQVRELNAMTKLRLSGPRIEDWTLDRLDACRALEHLEIQQAPLTGQRLASLGRLPRLRRLQLRQCDQLTDQAILGIGQLEQLVLLAVDVPAEVAETQLLEVARLEKLKDLRLSGPAVSDALIRELARLRQLRVLTLIDCPEVTQHGIAALGQLRSLQQLTLMNLDVEEAGLQSWRTLNSLQKLRMPGTSVSDSGLAHLAQLPSLQILDLSECRLIGDVGLGYLAQLATLEDLNLFATQITVDGLGKLTQLSSLKRLNLDRVAIGPEVAEVLPRFTNLEWLHLGKTKIDASVLDSVRQIKTLRSVVLNDCAPLSQAEIDGFWDDAEQLVELVDDQGRRNR